MADGAKKIEVNYLSLKTLENGNQAQGFRSASRAHIPDATLAKRLPQTKGGRCERFVASDLKKRRHQTPNAANV